MQVSGSGNVHGPHSLQGPHGPRPKAPASPTQQTGRPAAIDQVDISPEAARASEAGEIRTDRVAEIRSQIAAGTYETADKLDAALDRLLDEIG